jgi:LysM repeat protein
MFLRTVLVAVVAVVVMLGALSAYVLTTAEPLDRGAAPTAAPTATVAPAPAALPTAASPTSPGATPLPAAPQSAVVTATPVPTPVPSGPRVYVVREGDTLWSVAQEHGVTVEELMEANDLEDRNYIWWGQRLVIPE